MWMILLLELLMGEEVNMTDFDVNGVDDDRVSAWEVGLPNVDNLTPLS